MSIGMSGLLATGTTGVSEPDGRLAESLGALRDPEEEASDELMEIVEKLVASPDVEEEVDPEVSPDVEEEVSPEVSPDVEEELTAKLMLEVAAESAWYILA